MELADEFPTVTPALGTVDAMFASFVKFTRALIEFVPGERNATRRVDAELLAIRMYLATQEAQTSEKGFPSLAVFGRLY